MIREQERNNEKARKKPERNEKGRYIYSEGYRGIYSKRYERFMRWIVSVSELQFDKP